MSKQCPKCGNFLLENERFCTRCGANLNEVAAEQPSAASQQPAPEQPAYQQSQQNYNNNVPPVPPVAPPPQYNYNYTYNQQVQSEQPMTVGQWVGTIIVTSWFGIISLIITLVWAFGDSTPKAKKNYCRAVLILDLIAVGIIVLMFIIFAIAGVGIFSSVANSGNYYYY